MDILSEVLNPHFAENAIVTVCCTIPIQCFLLILQVIAYYDELEVVNPYVKKHKLGCLFFTLGNIRPQYWSSLKAINLVSLSKYVNTVWTLFFHASLKL